MNPRFAATLELQRPDYDVCPYCKQETAVYIVTCDGHLFETHRCPEHGNVVPMRSVVVNPW